MTTTATNPRLAAALLYAAVLGPVLNLHAPLENGACDCNGRDADDPDKHPIGKHPRTKNGLKDATRDPAKIEMWWGPRMWPQGNVGLDLAAAGLVDIAPDSVEYWAEFMARCRDEGCPPPLKFASSEEGHEHWLYARPDDCATYRDCHTGEYDILSAGYAIMPPSLHRTLRTYTWLEPADGVIERPRIYAPRWAVEILNRKGARTTAEPAGDSTDDGPPVELRGDALERWYGRLYERKTGGAVDRSYSLWWLAVVLLEAGASRRLVEQCLAERDVSLGWEKFSGRSDAPARYRIIVDRAVAGAGPGRAKTQQDQQRKQQQPPKPPKDPLEYPADFPTAAEIAGAIDEDIEWYHRGTLGKELLTEFDGAAKRAGKTTYLLGLCHAILFGEEFLGEPTRYSPILYLTEQSPPSFKRNLARAGLLARRDFRALHFNRAVGHEWEYIVERARFAAKEMGAHILIVDTLGQFSKIRGEEENRSGVALEKMEPLQAATADGLAVLVSRHDRKGGGEVGDSGRGSNAYGGVADIIIHIQRLPGDRTGKERQRLLEGIGRFEETPEQALVELVPGEEGEPYSYRLIGDAGEVRHARLRIDVLANLPTDSDQAMPEGDLREILGVSKSELLKVLWELMKDHQVRRVGDGKRGSPYRYYQVAWEAGDDD